MARKVALIDIGELGWSLELSAHARWLKEHDYKVEILTYEDRQALYPFTDILSLVPHINACQDGLSVKGIENKIYHFKQFLNYPLHKDFKFACHKFWGDKTSFKPYRATAHYDPTILIFPRYRREKGYSDRNIQLGFWERLAMLYPVTSIGRDPGSYRVEEAKIDRVSNKTTVQDVINHCNSAIFAVGSQSSLPKLSLLQGVPTFIIGHEKERHTVADNWMGTECYFYETKDYDIDVDDCLNEIQEWANGKLELLETKI